MTEGVLQNHNVLVIEDEYLVAMDLQDKLRDLGAVVVGPIGRLDEALAVIEAGTTIDSAVLDINLGGQAAYPAADLLLQRNIPFVFTTGYDDSAIPARFQDVVSLKKPVEAEKLRQALINA